MDILLLLLLVFSLLWVLVFPVIAYPYYKKLKKEYDCTNGLFAFAIFTGLAIFATPYIAYAIFVAVWFGRALTTIPLLLYPFCILYGLYLFYKSYTRTSKNNAIWYLVATWGSLILLVLSSFLAII